MCEAGEATYSLSEVSRLLGVSRMTLHRWMLFASISDEEFEAVLADFRAKGKRLSTTAVADEIKRRTGRARAYEERGWTDGGMQAPPEVVGRDDAAAYGITRGCPPGPPGAPYRAAAAPGVGRTRLRGLVGWRQGVAAGCRTERASGATWCTLLGVSDEHHRVTLG
jgi:hypothetical protein